MARIRLEAEADLVQQYVYEKDPVRAVTELIWNALDADAHNVTVTIERSPVDTPERISVVDDGHGMTPGPPGQSRHHHHPTVGPARDSVPLGTVAAAYQTHRPTTYAHRSSLRITQARAEASS